MAFVNFLPFLAMVLVQVGYAGMNITSKLAMDAGMKPLVLVAYRQIFATISMIPFAYFLEWRTRPSISKPILFQIFLCSVFGATMNQVFYFVGLKYSTPTIACALTNILPALTFVLAVIFRQETAVIKRISGQAKVLGTVVCVGGAMLLSFYHGHVINISESRIHWHYIDSLNARDSSDNNGNSIAGPIFLFMSSLAWSIWFIIQGRLGKQFPAPYTTTALICFMASIQCVVIGVSVERKMYAWSLASNTRLIASIYAGVVSSALAFSLMSWSIEKKGPLYVSVFSPLLLVIVAVLSWAIFHEKLYVGTAIGSFLVVAGLYAVIWGKDKEMKTTDELLEDWKYEKDEIELQNEKDDVEFQKVNPNEKYNAEYPNGHQNAQTLSHESRNITFVLHVLDM